MGEKIPFPVWVISFPVLKIDFEFLGKICTRIFLFRGVGDIIRCPIWIIPFLVFVYN